MTVVAVSVYRHICVRVTEMTRCFPLYFIVLPRPSQKIFLHVCVRVTEMTVFFLDTLLFYYARILFLLFCRLPCFIRLVHTLQYFRHIGSIFFSLFWSYICIPFVLRRVISLHAIMLSCRLFFFRICFRQLVQWLIPFLYLLVFL